MRLMTISAAMAGEYVLGTLTAEERAEAERRIRARPDVRRGGARVGKIFRAHRCRSGAGAAARACAPADHRRDRNIERANPTRKQHRAVAPPAHYLARPDGRRDGDRCGTRLHRAGARPQPPIAGGKYVAVLEPEGPGPAFVATSILRLAPSVH